MGEEQPFGRHCVANVLCAGFHNSIGEPHRMNAKAAIKNGAVMVAAIIVAGLVMYQFQGNALIADAKKGYGG